VIDCKGFLLLPENSWKVLQHSTMPMAGHAIYVKPLDTVF
jgi:hypothetical protein